MKLSEVFAAAKLQLAMPSDINGDGTVKDNGQKKRKRLYICYAIDAAHDAGTVSLRDARRAIQFITDRLDGLIFLESWVQKRVGYDVICEWRSRHSVLEFRQKMQATRHAWLDSLIAEFAAKGD